jgi:hypothetical protein
MTVVPGWPREKIEVKHVEPRVFPGDGGVEMMRHSKIAFHLFCSARA